ncbi:MAG: hypothetical protein ABSC37_21165 [Xanthobacteraceae bacterium]|jgi:hypothetical protein
MAVIWIFLTVAFGLLFYGLRCRCQLVYGMFELVVALAVIVVTFYPHAQASPLLVEGPSWWGGPLSHIIGVTAGIYVMVRGLDNIDKGLPPKWRGKWDRIFFGSP